MDIIRGQESSAEFITDGGSKESYRLIVLRPEKVTYRLSGIVLKSQRSTWSFPS